MVSRHYLVSGQVQGVGYRKFAQKQASAIGLRGAVRNLRDGRVELVAVGLDSQVRPFESMLAKGPKLSAIDGIVRNEVSPEALQQILGDFLQRDFEILDDGMQAWSFNF